MRQFPRGLGYQLEHDLFRELGVSLEREDMNRRQIDAQRVRFKSLGRRRQVRVKDHCALVIRDDRPTEKVCVGSRLCDMVVVEQLEMLSIMNELRRRGMHVGCKSETYEFASVEDGLAEAGEIHGHHGDFPVPSLSGAPQGHGDDLVTKADTCIG